MEHEFDPTCLLCQERAGNAYLKGQVWQLQAELAKRTAELARERSFRVPRPMRRPKPVTRIMGDPEPVAADIARELADEGYTGVQFELRYHAALKAHGISED